MNATSHCVKYCLLSNTKITHDLKLLGVLGVLLKGVLIDLHVPDFVNVTSSP